MSGFRAQDLPMIRESQVKTVQHGSYLIKNRLRRGDFYRCETDNWDRDVEQVMVAQVDDGDALPAVAHYARVFTKKNGERRREIVMWIPKVEACR